MNNNVKKISDLVQKEDNELLEWAKNTKEQGQRFNSGKIRYDLLEPHAIEELAKIFSFGAKKYAPNNWLKGLPWMDVIASLKRHLAQFEKGEDRDQETQLLHMAHVAWNALAIVSYYKYRPEFDNRFKAPRRKIGLDIDNVLCDWTKGWGEKYNLPTRPDSWAFCYMNKQRLNGSKEELEEVYKNLPVLTQPCDIPFEAHCYITARSIDENLTKEWLQRNGFPTRPVYTVPFGASKVEVAKQSGIDIFVDDSYDNFVELNNAGIFTYLFDQPHNSRYVVPEHMRIKSLKELV
jgi:uncharacterized HAD superfamily protein